MVAAAMTRTARAAISAGEGVRRRPETAVMDDVMMGLLPEHDPEKCGAVFRQDHAQSRGSYPVAMALSRHPSSQRVDRRRPAAIFRPLREAGFGRPKAPVAELVDALDSKSSSARSAGSIPARGTILPSALIRQRSFYSIT